MHHFWPWSDIYNLGKLFLSPNRGYVSDEMGSNYKSLIGHMQLYRNPHGASGGKSRNVLKNKAQLSM